MLLNFFISKGFTQKEAEEIKSKFSVKYYKKGQLFVEENKISKYLGFIEQGFLQYFIVSNGEEKTTYAIGANNFVASLVSFLKQIPSVENIRAIVDSTIWVIDRADLIELQKNIPTFKSFYVAILEWQICCIDESRLDAIMLTAQERYEKMLAKEPILILTLPQQYLASILGVTPRHLSRIRNNIPR